MTKLTIFANIEAKEDQADFIKEELVKLLDSTRNRDGCIQSRLEQDNVDPKLFKFYEQWESREKWQNNRNTESLNDYLEKTEEYTKSFMLNEMTIVI